MYCALKLDSLSWTDKNEPKPTITLIDANDAFLFKPLMYELLSSDMEETDVAPSYEELLENTTVRFSRKEAMRVEPDVVLKTKSGSKVSGTGGEVVVRDAMTKEEERVKYDYLVVSLGAKVDFESEKNFVKGAKEFAMPFNGLEDVKKMREKIPSDARAADVRIVDKMLFNYRNIGFVHMLFPDAPIIHVRGLCARGSRSSRLGDTCALGHALAHGLPLELLPSQV